MNSKAFDVFERVLSTALQAGVGAAAGLAVTVADGSLDWRSALVTVGVASALSAIKNLQVLVAASPASVNEKALADAVEAALEAKLRGIADGVAPVKE